MNYPYFQKYLTLPEQRLRFKKHALKNKNILFENEHLQIGCKVTPLYDFYSSTNYLQLNLFIGNKTDRTIPTFSLDFKATNNLQLYVEEKSRTIKERTQYKERLVVGCSNYEEEILLLMDFQSTVVTLRNIPIPVTLLNLCIFSSAEPLPSSIQTQNDLQQLLQHKYQYIEEQQIEASSPIFKKNLLAQIQKYFSYLSKICQGVYIGQFSTKTLVNEYTLTLKVINQTSVKVCLASNEYQLFDQLFANLKFLLE